MREQFLKKGPPTCTAVQVTPKAEDEVCAGRNSANNAWYVNQSNGNRNNNNTNNRYRVAGASEFIANWQEWLAAEESSYHKKHHNFDAARVHYHLPELYALADEVARGEYKPRPMSAFVLTYPVFREAFAPDHIDCIVHHYTAPLFTTIAESVHAENGDISHGNRIGHSAQGMAERIREDVRFISRDYTRPCYRAHLDISGFFLHINRRKAYELVAELSKTYYQEPDREEKLRLLEVTLTSDPLEGCTLKSPKGAWKNVPANKTLFNGKPGYGLPIGKYPSQVVAGIYLAPVDAALVQVHGIREEHFVDDYDIIAPSVEKIHEAVRVMEPVLADLELQLHPRKRSIQPAHRGMLSCGRIVKGERIYISNRTVRACRKAIENLPVTLAGARELRQSLNSVLGLMSHCNTYNVQQRLACMALEKFGEWIYFRVKPNHFICTLKKKYTPAAMAVEEISTILNSYEVRKDHQRNCHSRKSREWQGGRRQAD